MAQIYFGNLRKAGFVPAPTTGMEATPVGRFEEVELANGGAFVSQSSATHRKFQMAWGATLDTELAFLNDYRNGLYGPGLLYFNDPFAADVNILPPHWAAPMLTCDGGWPSLFSPGFLPAAVATAANAYNQPYNSANYTVQGVAGLVPPRVLTLLIPPTHTLHIGFSGAATGSAVMRVQPINLNGTLAATTNLTLLSPTASTRMNASFSGATYKAIQVYMTGTTDAPGTMTLASGKAVYAVTGTPPVLTGNYVSGRGHTGLRMSNPTLTYIQSRTNKKYVSAAVDLTEIGAWL